MSGGGVVAWRAEWDDDAWNEYSDDRDSEGWESWRSPPDRIVPLVLATDYAVLQSDLAAAIARAEALSTALRDVLERDGGKACHCINHSRKAEREYEAGTCPHQRAQAFIAAQQAEGEAS